MACALVTLVGLRRYGGVPFRSTLRGSLVATKCLLCCLVCRPWLLEGSLYVAPNLVGSLTGGIWCTVIFLDVKHRDSSLSRALARSYNNPSSLPLQDIA